MLRFPDRFPDPIRLVRMVNHLLHHPGHGQGIFHRDIKPSNLLLDVQGTVWVADFGLAKSGEGSDLTRTGDIVGTVRYMAPEQFRWRCDARSDVYSLGLTLYELLALRPAYDEPDPRRLIELVAHQEPQPLKKLNAAVPRDLATIVHKAIEREPERRYATAGALANDLQRFVDGKPIQARRVRAHERLARWARRNPLPAALAAAVLLLLAGIAGGVGWAVGDRLAREEELDQVVQRTLDETGPLIEQGKWAEALVAVERAGKLLKAARRTERPARLVELERQLALAQRLEQIYQGSKPAANVDLLLLSREGPGHIRSASLDIPNDDYFREQDSQFAKAFREFGIDLEALAAAEAAERIGRTSTREALVKALGDWAATRKRLRWDDDALWQKLVEIAAQADSDQWRNEFRKALLRRDRPALETLADAIPMRAAPPATVYLLGYALRDLGAVDKAMAVLKDGHRHHPDDYWLNDALASLSEHELHPPRYDDALRYYATTSALRPRSARAHFAVAQILQKKGELDEAFAEYSKAVELSSETIELEPNKSFAWHNRGLAYYRLGQYDKAIADHSKAIQLEPNNAELWNSRGYAYYALRRHGKAISDYSRAIELDPTLTWAFGNRSLAYRALHQYDKALADLSKLIELEPNNAWALTNRAVGYWALKQQDKALADIRAIKMDAQGAKLIDEFAWFLATSADPTLRDVPRAVELAKKTVALAPWEGSCWNTLGAAHYRAGDWQAAIAALEKAVELNCGGNGHDWFFLAMAQWQFGEKENAQKSFDRAAQFMDKYASQNEELLRFRAEAEELLGKEKQ